jgi:hypothetical protein
MRHISYRRKTHKPCQRSKGRCDVECLDRPEKEWNRSRQRVLRRLSNRAAI